MPLVYGIISPHPPIIIPEIGGADTKKSQKTIDALELATSKLAQTQPDNLIIIAPHEGHGFDVPMYYLKQHIQNNPQIEEILVTEPSYQYYYDFGRDMGHKLAQNASRTAIVASGDLSHVLKSDGPYGFNPAGPELDNAIVQALRHSDTEALLGLDPQLLENGAECGLRSILFLLGALADTSFRSQILSYEGPFGVGYLVATYEPQEVA